jgi:pilus assembly protein Flp/PilA
MNKFINAATHSVRSFIKDEDGAQVVEYALIIALVSITLAVALSALGDGPPSIFTAFITRVTNCLSGTAACVVAP